MNVSCEACHGPGSRHVSWAQRPPASSSTRATDNGLTVHLTERRKVAWTIAPGTLKPMRSAPRTTSSEIDVCAQCHSRRSQITDGYYAGAPLPDFYEPATIEPSLYYPDGQQREEVTGSFLQSRWRTRASPAAVSRAPPATPGRKHALHGATPRAMTRPPTSSQTSAGAGASSAPRTYTDRRGATAVFACRPDLTSRPACRTPAPAVTRIDRHVGGRGGARWLGRMRRRSGFRNRVSRRRATTARR